MANHIWRKMEDPPYLRFACTIEKADTSDGYKLSDVDVSVADPGFLHDLAEHMVKPFHVRSSMAEGDMTMEFASVRNPGEVGHFETAIRSIPNALLSAVGRG